MIKPICGDKTKCSHLLAILSFSRAVVDSFIHGKEIFQRSRGKKTAENSIHRQWNTFFRNRIFVSFCFSRCNTHISTFKLEGSMVVLFFPLIINDLLANSCILSFLDTSYLKQFYGIELSWVWQHAANVLEDDAPSFDWDNTTDGHLIYNLSDNADEVNTFMCVFRLFTMK
jgi:hypothetical protein